MLLNTQAVRNCYCYCSHILHVYIQSLPFLSCTFFSFFLMLCPQWDMLILLWHSLLCCPLPQLSHTAVCRTLTCIYQATQHNITLWHWQLTPVNIRHDAEQTECPLSVNAKNMQSNVRPLRIQALSTVHWAPKVQYPQHISTLIFLL